MEDAAFFPITNPLNRELPRRAGAQRGLHPRLPELRPGQRLARRGQAGWLRTPPWHCWRSATCEVAFNTADGVVQAVRGLSFDVERGSTLAIVGESGSGKSVATQTIAGLTRGARVTGAARFDGIDLIGADAGGAAAGPRARRSA